MDLLTLLSFAPKIAAAVLVLLGILIAIEVKSILGSKKKLYIDSLPIPTKPEAVITKVQFPDTGIHEEIPKKSEPRSRKPLIVLISIPIIVVALFGLVHFISARPNPGQTQEIPFPASPTPLASSPRILIYKEDEAGKLAIITYDQLKQLQPGTEIIIAVSSSVPLSSADFLVNDELLSATDKTANGELFVRYTLKPNVTNYSIAVNVQ